MPLVYRTIFTVPAPHDVIDLSLDLLPAWLSRGSGGHRVNVRRSGHYALGHQSTAKVVQHENPDEGIRFLRLKTESEHDDGAVWRTVVTAVRDPGRVSDHTVWVDLTVDVPHGSDEQRLDIAPPEVVRLFLRAAPCADGAATLTETPVIVRGRDDRSVDTLLAAIRDDGRRTAVIATGAPADLTVAAWQQSMAQVLRPACGMHAGYVLDRAAQEKVARRLPGDFDIPAGGVRTFRPRVRLTDPEDYRRHPRLTTRTMDNARNGAAVRAWVGRALMHSVREVVLDTPLPDELRTLDALLNEEEAELSAQPTAPEPTGTAALVYRTDTSSAAARPSVRLSPDADRAAELAGEIRRRDTRITELEKERERLLAELAETMEERDTYREWSRAARHENAWLRDQLRGIGQYALAEAKAPVLRGEQPPDDFEELLERMTDPAAFPHLHLTIDDPLAEIRELSGTKKERLWATKAWEALHALNDYARYQLTHPDGGRTFHDYLRDPPDGFHTIPVRRVATHESDTVRNRAKLSGKRVFRVPTEVHPDGQVAMFAHIKLDTEYGICPRLYYYPDLGPRRTNRIYIGYLGRHLPVHSTN